MTLTNRADHQGTARPQGGGNLVNQRRSIRLDEYDYTHPGAYYVTICTHQRAALFGAVIDGVMHLNEWGSIVQAEWMRTATLRENVELDAFVVMPNHVHGIIVLIEDGTVADHHRRGMMDDAPATATRRGMMHHAPVTTTREFGSPIPRSLPTIIGAFKAAVTRQVNRLTGTPGHPVWQRNYYEHIIRNERSLNALRAYIAHNPANWHKDTLYTD